MCERRGRLYTWRWEEAKKGNGYGRQEPNSLNATQGGSMIEIVPQALRESGQTRCRRYQSGSTCTSWIFWGPWRLFFALRKARWRWLACGSLRARPCHLCRNAGCRAFFCAWGWQRSCLLLCCICGAALIFWLLLFFSCGLELSSARKVCGETKSVNAGEPPIALAARPSLLRDRSIRRHASGKFVREWDTWSAAGNGA